MKNLLSILLLVVSISVKSQITLEHTTSTQFYKISTTTSGDKYLSEYHNGNDLIPDTVVLYNSDWSIYRSILIPVGFSLTFDDPDHGGTKNNLVTDKLFNSDTLIELVIEKSVGGGNVILSVMNELGQIEYNFPDSIQHNLSELWEINGSYKLVFPLNYGTYKIYSLPGTLPCNQCNSLGTGIGEVKNTGEFGLNVYPNPFNNTLDIDYNFSSQQDNSRIVVSDMLGREIKTIPVKNQSDKLSLNTSGISKGMIIVSLFGGDGNVISKKVIKID